MIVNAYGIGNDKVLEPIAAELSVAALPDGSSHLWIDIEKPSPEELRELLVPLGLHLLVLENLLDPASSPLVAPYEGCLFVRFPFLRDEGLEDPGNLCLLILENTLVTVHASSVPALEQLVDDFTSTMRFQSEGIAPVFYHIVDRLIDDDMAAALASARRGQALAEQMEDGANAMPIDELRGLKRRVSRMADTLEEQRLCVANLQAAEMEFLDAKGLHLHFRDTLAHLEYAFTSTVRQQTHLSELYQQHVLNLQDRTNRRLKILTILSSIFMPLTLITGIYGMNFRHMPELQWTYAYPAVIAAMLVIASLLLWNFYRRGWFD